ncbi:MAG: BA14K family protein [Hyphomicrobiaceae bacterium]
MRSISTALCAATLCAVTSASASATPIPSMGQLHRAVTAPPVEQVKHKKYNRHYRANRRNGYANYRRHRHHGSNLGNLFFGTVAGLIIANAIRENRARDSDMEACAQRYRSFDWRTGTYLSYDGNRYVCPYLD